MTIGTAMLILGLLYLGARFEGFRTALFAIFGIWLGLIWWVVENGADKPQTLFYDYKAHPAFLMQAGSVCPADRHVWNHWCVK